MKFDDLPKNKQLLIYMMECINSSGETFIIDYYCYDIVARGITKNRTSLSSMLQTLAKQGYVKHVGQGNWLVTEDGEAEATYWLNKCYEDDTDFDEDVFATSKIDGLNISDKLEDAAVKLALCKVELDKSNCTAVSYAVQAAINAIQAANAVIESLKKQDQSFSQADASSKPMDFFHRLRFC